MLFVVVVLGTMNNGHGIISVKVFLSQAELVIPNKDGQINPVTRVSDVMGGRLNLIL